MGALFSSNTTRSAVRAFVASLAIFFAAAIAWPLLTGPAAARGPEKHLRRGRAGDDAVVNISTSRRWISARAPYRASARIAVRGVFR